MSPPSFKAARRTSPKVEHPSELKGFTDLTAEDQTAVRAEIDALVKYLEEKDVRALV